MPQHCRITTPPMNVILQCFINSILKPKNINICYSKLYNKVAFKRKSSKNTFETIKEHKVIINCRHCGRKIEVKNMNQKICIKCGYRGK